MSHGIRILLVEDTPIAQIMVKTLMTYHGCEVDVADDGATALEKALTIPYDLILMDIGLGNGPDGFETTTHIKIQSLLNHQTPVVAVTSHEGADYRQKAQKAGMVAYLKKPFTAENAKSLIERFKKIPRPPQ